MSTDIGAGNDCDEVVAGGGADIEAGEVADVAEPDEAEDEDETGGVGVELVEPVELAERVTAAPDDC